MADTLVTEPWSRWLNMTARFSKRLELDYSNVLVAIFDLMLTGGIQGTDPLAMCTRALKQAEARVGSLRVHSLKATPAASRSSL
jgi:hypothetical protein